MIDFEGVRNKKVLICEKILLMLIDTIISRALKFPAWTVMILRSPPLVTAPITPTWFFPILIGFGCAARVVTLFERVCKIPLL